MTIRRFSSILRDNLIHDMYKDELKKLGELGYRIPPELKSRGMGERMMQREEDDYDDDMGMRDGYSYSYGQRGDEGMGERRRRRSNGQWH